jgi:hypothetical protein
MATFPKQQSDPFSLASSVLIGPVYVHSGRDWRKALVDFIQHPFYCCQFDPRRADAGHRVVIVEEAATPRVHCRTEIVGEETKNDEEGRGDVNVKPFSS